MEPEIQRDLARREKKVLVSFLKRIGASQALIQGIERLEEKRIGMNRMTPEGENEEDLPRYLLEKLVEEAGPKGFYFHDFPAFSLYAGYLILQSELESKSLFEEIEVLFEKILNDRVRTEDQKNILELFRDAQLLKKLLHLELTRKEWARISYREGWVRPVSMAKRLRQLGSQKTSLSAGISFYPESTRAFKFALRFYELARQRESVFYYTMKQEMLKRFQDKAVLVTGGFHTEGLMELFREEGINYGVLTPNMRERGENSNYKAVMLQNRPTLFDLANLEAVLNMQRSEVRAGQGMDLRANTEQVVDTFLSVIGETIKNRSELRKTLQYFDEQSRYAKDNGIQFKPLQSERHEDIYTLKLPEKEGRPDAYEVIFRENQEGISLHLNRGGQITPLLPPSGTSKIPSDMFERTQQQKELLAESQPSENLINTRAEVRSLNDFIETIDEEYSKVVDKNADLGNLGFVELLARLRYRIDPPKVYWVFPMAESNVVKETLSQMWDRHEELRDPQFVFTSTLIEALKQYNGPLYKASQAGKSYIAAFIRDYLSIRNRYSQTSERIGRPDVRRAEQVPAEIHEIIQEKTSPPSDSIRSELRTIVPRRELRDIQGIVFDALPLDENAAKTLAPVIKHLHDRTNDRKPRFQGELMEGRKVIGIVTFPNGIIRVGLAPALAVMKGNVNSVAHIQLASRAGISKDRFGYAQFGIDLDSRQLRIRPDIPAPSEGHVIYAEDMHDQIIKIAGLLQDVLKTIHDPATGETLYTDEDIHQFDAVIDLPANGIRHVFNQEELKEIRRQGGTTFFLARIAALKLIDFDSHEEVDISDKKGKEGNGSLVNVLFGMAYENLNKIDPELASGILFAEEKFVNDNMDETVQSIHAILEEIQKRGYDSDKFAKVAQNALNQVLNRLPQNRSEVRTKQEQSKTKKEFEARFYRGEFPTMETVQEALIQAARELLGGKGAGRFEQSGILEKLVQLSVQVQGNDAHSFMAHKGIGIIEEASWKTPGELDRYFEQKKAAAELEVTISEMVMDRDETPLERSKILNIFKTEALKIAGPGGVGVFNRQVIPRAREWAGGNLKRFSLRVVEILSESLRHREGKEREYFLRHAISKEEIDQTKTLRKNAAPEALEQIASNVISDEAKRYQQLDRVYNVSRIEFRGSARKGQLTLRSDIDIRVWTLDGTKTDVDSFLSRFASELHRHGISLLIEVSQINKTSAKTGKRSELRGISDRETEPQMLLEETRKAFKKFSFKPYDFQKIDQIPFQNISVEIRVASLVRGLLTVREAEASVVDFIQGVAKTVDQGPLSRFHSIVASHSLVSSEGAPASVVIVTGGVPSEEVLAIEAELLAKVNNQGIIYVVALEDRLDLEAKRRELRAFDDFVQALQHHEDAGGREIGKRLGVVITTRDNALRAIEKARSKLAGAIAANAKNTDALTVQNQHSLLVIEKGLEPMIKVDKDRNSVYLLKSPVLNDASQMIARSLIAKWYAKLKGDSEKLTQKLNEVVIRRDELIPEGLNALAGRLGSLIQAYRAEIRTKASA
ncbi:MAG TPA: hypothetical protein VD913_00290 [bacterium]|nr:hypothetical protein [bacterium]